MKWDIHTKAGEGYIRKTKAGTYEVKFADRKKIVVTDGEDLIGILKKDETTWTDLTHWGNNENFLLFLAGITEKEGWQAMRYTLVRGRFRQWTWDGCPMIFPTYKDFLNMVFAPHEERPKLIAQARNRY